MARAAVGASSWGWDGRFANRSKLNLVDATSGALGTDSTCFNLTVHGPVGVVPVLIPVPKPVVDTMG